MNTYFLIAGILCVVLGLAHSIFGEHLIFKDKRNKGSLVPTKVKTGLRVRHLRILWATWHLASVFGCCIAALIIKIALEQNTIYTQLIQFIINSTIFTMLTSSSLVLIGTRGKHPGWIVLLVIAILLVIGN